MVWNFRFLKLRKLKALMVMVTESDKVASPELRRKSYQLQSERLTLTSRVIEALTELSLSVPQKKLLSLSTLAVIVIKHASINNQSIV